ncbi:hypothetical protein Q9L58_001288 [Maublancomyces gigas]|uniref:Uncharacterized protein n=1 Tax=Discina gigas TaxID=1032678 RepID=A0ABR3GUW0_9PEZI
MDWTSNSSTGKKRPPNIDGEDDLVTEQPLSKKLAKLSLHMEEQSRNRRGTKARYLFTIPQHEAYKHPIHDGADQQLQKQQKQVTPPDDELMEVDNDNPHVVFIHDIDEELGSDDGDENDKKGLIFVPDIEKRLTRIPYALVNESSKISEPSFGTSQALVLYTVPSSLSVSREQDNVRRAIIEARARIRQKQAGDTRQQGLMEAGEVMADDVDGSGLNSGLDEDDPDAMDIE